MRLPKEILNKLQVTYGVDRIWSYSRLSTYLEHPWEYRMLYLEKKPRSSNVYTHWGTISHDLIQDMYDGKHGYDDMINIFEEKLGEWSLLVSDGNRHLKFPGEKVQRGYVNNLRHYFRNTEITDYKVKNETSVLLRLEDKIKEENIVMVGYVDSEYIDDEGYLNLVDYKSSSMSQFTGKLLPGKQKQLKLYAMAISQYRNFPIEKIKMRFDMMKYVKVQYLQKNGKWGGSHKERDGWVKSIEKRLYKSLTEVAELDPFEAEEVLEEAIMNNSIDNFPQVVKDNYRIGNHYIDFTMTQEDADELEKFVIKTVREVKEKEKGDWEAEFPEPIIDEHNKFYYTVLSPNLLKYHEGYKAQQAQINGTYDNSAEILEEFFS